MLQKLRENWKPGLSVALVSIPLSISLAVASGASPVAGIITAIWAGLVAAIIGGSNYNIVGPAGALSSIVAVFAVQYGVTALPILAIMAGLFILLAWGLRLERYLVFVPAAVVHGFTLGVAITIAMGQSKVIVSSPQSILIFGISMVVLFVLTKYLPKFPTVVIVAVLGIILGWNGLGGLITLGDKFPNLTAQLIAKPTWVFDSHMLATAGIVALVAILETLLSAKIADGMTKTRHDSRKEMLGLGLANIASGLCGGLPATAVLARTALNIRSGATDRISALISSILIAGVALILLSYFRFIPMVIIAAILVFVAIRMVELKHLRALWDFDRWGLGLAFLVATVTVWEDPMWGILLGTGVSLLVLLERLSRGHYDLVLNPSKSGDIAVYSVKGQLLHLNAHTHRERLEKKLNGSKHVVLRLREVNFLDQDGLECLTEIVETLHSQGRTVALTGVNDYLSDKLFGVPQMAQLQAEGLVFAKTTQALKYFGYKV